MTTGKPLPKHVQAVRARGKLYYYFRRGKIRHALPGRPGSPEFSQAYADLLAGAAPRPLPLRTLKGSIGELLAAYLASPEFTALATSTRASYRRQLEHLRAAIGDHSAQELRRAHVIAFRNKLALSRGARSADYFVAVVSRAFGVGADLGLVEVNPAAGIASIAKAESYRPWPPDARQAFEGSAAPEHLRRGYFLALWTGLRASDVCSLGPQHCDGAAIRYRPGKTASSSRVEVVVPISPELAAEMATWSASGLLYVTRDFTLGGNSTITQMPAAA